MPVAPLSSACSTSSGSSMFAVQLDRHAVERRRGRGLQPLQLLALELELALAQLVLGEHLRGRG